MLVEVVSDEYALLIARQLLSCESDFVRFQTEGFSDHLSVEGDT